MASKNISILPKFCLDPQFSIKSFKNGLTAHARDLPIQLLSGTQAQVGGPASHSASDAVARYQLTFHQSQAGLSQREPLDQSQSSVLLCCSWLSSRRGGESAALRRAGKKLGWSMQCQFNNRWQSCKVLHECQGSHVGNLKKGHSVISKIFTDSLTNEIDQRQHHRYQRWRHRVKTRQSDRC